MAVGFIITTIRDLRHTDVVVISKLLSDYTAAALFCGVVVYFAIVNGRNTLVKAKCRVRD